MDLAFTSMLRTTMRMPWEGRASMVVVTRRWRTTGRASTAPLRSRQDGAAWATDFASSRGQGRPDLEG
uniref:Uncharacterized protein n=1 Tax=Arundo donax TaxID=35708 RepID=A0A0A8XRT3_ARUDO